jgi:hypothetical protein
MRQSVHDNASGNVLSINVHLDSHADCCVFSEHSKILYSDVSRSVNLTPFKSDLGLVEGIPVSTIAIAYDDPISFSTYILIFHEALQIPGMDHHILCPNQLRDNDIRVNDIPLLYTPVEERNQHTHSIVTNDLVIPLSMDGVHSSFPSRVPTEYELANVHMFPQLSLTADCVWEPHDLSFRDNEYAIRTSLTSVCYAPFEN